MALAIFHLLQSKMMRIRSKYSGQMMLLPHITILQQQIYRRQTSDWEPQLKAQLKAQAQAGYT